MYNSKQIKTPSYNRLLRRSFATPATNSNFSVHPEIAARTPPYGKLIKNLTEVRRVLGTQGLTLAEKILYSHLDNVEDALGGRNGKVRGEAYLKLKVDRVAMQDASAQMALLQFMTCGLGKTAVPASIHCDHMIVGENGADVDLPRSIEGNKEVFDFLGSAAKKFGIQFWAPGSGIIHQIVLENYAAPGLMMLGTDSREQSLTLNRWPADTPNGGGLGAIAIGVGGADAVDALVDAPWELRAPKILGVRLEGELSGWATPKDVILNLAGQLTVRNITGLEWKLSVARAWLQFVTWERVYPPSDLTPAPNAQPSEVGATTSLFPFTSKMISYLNSTRRAPIAEAAEGTNKSHNFLRADTNAIYDQVITINLSELEPHINGPFTPDLSTPLSKFKDAVKENEWPEQLSAGLIGSCTNSSYQDMLRAEDLVKQAEAAGLKPKVDFFVTPGSEQIRATLERDETLDVFGRAGGTVLANACGPCIGQWKRNDISKGDTNAILTSYNRNFRARNDGNSQTMNFLASPEIVTAMIYSGDMSFNPITDTLPTPSGQSFKFSAPSGSELPSQGFEPGNLAFVPSNSAPSPSTPVVVSPTSSRLALLEPFEPFGAVDLKGLKVLLKIKGKCTTDHISAAGSWLKYKGHLENISNNTLIGAMNAETGEVNKVHDANGDILSIPDLARRWKAQGVSWLVVAENNYGEGSAREHAALQPRYLGGKVILAKSFARIHEANLKKQGVVPLTFADGADYDSIGSCDSVDTVGLYDMLVSGGDGEVFLDVTRKTDGRRHRIPVKHTFSKDQAGFVLAGSALNLLSKRAAIA
ncbi:unnamed protein product, partial [Tuber aestivum]